MYVVVFLESTQKLIKTKNLPNTIIKKQLLYFIIYILISIDMEGHDHQFKVILVGNLGSGKSTILHHYIKEEYPETIVMDSASKTINVDGKIVNLKIWDTAGQERYGNMSSFYYNDATAMIYVYDLTSNGEGLESSLNECLSHAKDISVKYCVGNKLELYNSYSRNEMPSLAEMNGMKHFELSAKKLADLKDLFERIAKDCLENIK
jgi:Ras-related protein Rab-18